MNKYQNGKIYKLVCDNTPIVYYGSTCQKLSVRLSVHKCRRNCSSKELYDKGNVTIHLIENYPCNSRKELEARERIYIEFMLKNFDHKIICNKQITGRTKKEYRIDNKDKANERSKEWLKNNKEKRKQYRKIKISCECGSLISKCELARHKRSKKHINYINNECPN
jgi:hypothetical protein